MFDDAISSGQIRAARALLHWSQQKLATEANVSSVALKNFERGATVPRNATIAALVKALTDAGITFTEGGVRPSS